MPVKIQYEEKDFEYLKEQLISIGFRAISKQEIIGTLMRLEMKAPRSNPGSEEGFTFTANHLTVYVWTTFNRSTHLTKEEDLGWVLITQGDKAEYFAKPMRRTSGFLKKLLSRAWVTKYKAEHRPCCPSCGKLMNIYQRVTGGCYWGCFNKNAHERPIFKAWDLDMPIKAQKFLDDMRALVDAYHERNRRLGIVRTPAKVIRKKWKIGKPENAVKIT